jgi:hypothetical protein
MFKGMADWLLHFVSDLGAEAVWDQISGVKSGVAKAMEEHLPKVIGSKLTSLEDSRKLVVPYWRQLAMQDPIASDNLFAAQELRQREGVRPVAPGAAPGSAGNYLPGAENTFMTIAAKVYQTMEKTPGLRDEFFKWLGHLPGHRLDAVIASLDNDVWNQGFRRVLYHVQQLGGRVTAQAAALAAWMETMPTPGLTGFGAIGAPAGAMNPFLRILRVFWNLGNAWFRAAFVVTVVLPAIIIPLAVLYSPAAAMWFTVASLLFISAVLVFAVPPMLWVVLADFPGGRVLIEKLLIGFTGLLVIASFLWFVPVGNTPGFALPLVVLAILYQLASGLGQTKLAKTAAALIVLLGLACFMPRTATYAVASISSLDAAALNSVRTIGADPNFTTITVSLRGENVESEAFTIGGPFSDIPSLWYFRWEGSCEVKAHFKDFGNTTLKLDEDIPYGLRGPVVFTGPAGETVEIFISKEKPVDNSMRGRCSPAAAK